MVRFFAWLDDAFSHITGPALLLSLVFGSVAYFGGWLPDPTVVVGTAAGIAVDVIFWLQQRRVRAAYAVLARTLFDDPRRDLIRRQVRVQVAMMLFTGLVSCYTSNLFLFTYWHPTTTVLPIWLQTVVRGCLIPVLLWITSSLVPLHEDASAYLTRNAHAIMRTTLRATLKQMRRRITIARQRGADLVPVSVALMADAGDHEGAKRLRMISEGIAQAEAETALPDIAPFLTDPPMWTPTGPGTPGAMPDGSDKPTAEAAPIPIRSHKRMAAQAQGDAEARIRTLLARDPGIPMNQLVKRARVSFKDAGLWRRKILNEMSGGQYAQ